jgi:hypothetical protein
METLRRLWIARALTGTLVVAAVGFALLETIAGRWRPHQVRRPSGR